MYVRFVMLCVATSAMGQLLTANATTKMPALRCALFVGDVLTKRDVGRLQNLAVNVKVINMYGTTETQRAVRYDRCRAWPRAGPVRLSGFRLADGLRRAGPGSYLTVTNDSSMERRKEILPAGRGMKDVQVLILTPSMLDDSGGVVTSIQLSDSNGTVAITHRRHSSGSDMMRCGIGEMGELYMRSPHMAAGYLGLDDATKQKFLQNPFSPSNPRDRLYRTGDIGRYLPDGIGRKTASFAPRLRRVPTLAR